MTADNFQAIVHDLKDNRPFRIFAVELTRGQKFEVDHPRALGLCEDIAVFLSPGGKVIWFDHENVSQIIGAPAHAWT